MDERLQARLGALKQEFAVGQAHLQDMENKQRSLRETMLRISGAIQVLEELLNDGQAALNRPEHLDESLLVMDQKPTIAD